VDIPIINEVYAVLYQDKSPHDAVADLMNRKARPEQD
jgi:glycerol-3-phosphate dehydrogenase